MNIQGERRVRIDATAAAVWSLVADVTQMGRWSPITNTATWVPPATGPVVGAQFRGTNRLPLIRRWTSTATITACQPGRTFAFAIGADPNTTWAYHFEPHPDGGTTVTETWHMIREPAIVLAYYRLINQPARIAAGVETTLPNSKPPPVRGLSQSVHAFDASINSFASQRSPGTIVLVMTLLDTRCSYQGRKALVAGARRPSSGRPLESIQRRPEAGRNPASHPIW